MYMTTCTHTICTCTSIYLIYVCPSTCTSIYPHYMYMYINIPTICMYIHMYINVPTLYVHVHQYTYYMYVHPHVHQYTHTICTCTSIYLLYVCTSIYPHMYTYQQNLSYKPSGDPEATRSNFREPKNSVFRKHDQFFPLANKNPI